MWIVRGGVPASGGGDAYLGPEARARINIARQLAECGWVLQRHRDINLGAGPGVAVRQFPMAKGHGESDYVLFVDREAVGVIEAKKEGSTLTEVEWRASKYATRPAVRRVNHPACGA